MLNGLNEGRRDFSWQKWSYKIFTRMIGLEGEVLSLHSLDWKFFVECVQGSFVAQKQPLTWYKTTFNLTYGNDPLALDMGSMGKGQVWINKQSIGILGPHTKHLVLVVVAVILERMTRRNAYAIAEMPPRDGEAKVSCPPLMAESKRVCADIFELQPTLLSYQRQVSGTINQPLRPKAHLRCSSGQKISSIKFASFGTPAASRRGAVMPISHMMLLKR
ncbi:hypothetical protein IFM89_035420 [Coptis chinensis]|uniref:Beta-galactosidase galactose-binding domain-containing protein n=1 Tax=Coptis chinensis TaxID=261450 RepID=A0A835LTN9_9MAGN|nr:hypothetical protein IFM89_035420 [Coptis chinensis]